MNNYCSISLLTCFSKIFEKLIYDRLINFSKRIQYSFPRSMAFVPNIILHMLFLNINNNEYTGLIMLSFRYCMSLCHEELLIKLSHYGINGKAIDLFHSYLSNSHQYVYINGFSSSLQKIQCGVLQGSLLGPLLFLIYINDLTNAISTTPRLYANDTCLIVNSPSQKELELQINMN